MALSAQPGVEDGGSYASKDEAANAPLLIKTGRVTGLRLFAQQARRGPPQLGRL